MKNSEDKHLFAIYWQALSAQITTLELGKLFTITQEQLVHRISRVLRIEPNETLNLFDQKYNLTVRITKITKTNIEAELINKQTNIQYEPHVTVLLPLLKREALQESLYSCVELGAQEIWLITTQKSQHLRDTDREMQRLRTIAIAAAEQSKHFAIPDIQPPRALTDALALFNYNQTSAIFFDQAGKPLTQALDQLNKKKSTSILLLIGPEGDLSAQEKELVKKYPFIFAKLTPTILRAQQAITLGLGIVRALL